MKESASRNGRLARLALLPALPLLCALLLLSPGRGPSVTTAAEPAFQTPRPWTAVGSSGVVDEASRDFYAFDGAGITFNDNTAGNVIVARYNVTNTFDNYSAGPTIPGWKYLEVGSSVPPRHTGKAVLYKIANCATAPEPICTVTLSDQTPCGRCLIGSAVDFSTALFYVEVTLTRPAGSPARPRVDTLRIY